MADLKKLVASFLALIPLSSAQISGGAGVGQPSVIDLITHLIGIRIATPYEALGVAATLGVMWASVYIIFKTAIQFMDQELGDNYNNYFADAVGIEREDDRNLLAVLTLLITLSIIGTAGFAGIVYNWQSMIMLMFAFMVLGGTMFILIGGTGGIIGGTAYATAASTRVTARGIEETREAIDMIGREEDEVEDIEDDAEDDIDDGDDDEADDEADEAARELQRIIEQLEEVEEDLDEEFEDIIDMIEDDINRLQHIIDLLGD